jgi:hypothetical protein
MSLEEGFALTMAQRPVPETLLGIRKPAVSKAMVLFGNLLRIKSIGD